MHSRHDRFPITKPRKWPKKAVPSVNTINIESTANSFTF